MQKEKLDDITAVNMKQCPLISKSYNRMPLESNLDIGNWKLNCNHHLLPCPTQQQKNTLLRTNQPGPGGSRKDSVKTGLVTNALSVRIRANWAIQVGGDTV